MKRIYLSPSNQEHNAGKGNYGTEEQQMHKLAARVAVLLKARGFTVKTSNPGWSMTQVCADSNAFGADAHICLHTNAGGGDGTVAFYGSPEGKRLTQHIYGYVAKASPGSDEGMRSWAGLYEIGNTHAPCAYLELFFHDNYKEVVDYLAHEGKYAEAVAHGICDHFKVPWEKKGVDYRALKKAALKVAGQLGVDASKVDASSPKKGEPFEALLRAIADAK